MNTKKNKTKQQQADLRRAAHEAGRPEWGHGGPHDAGTYNSRSWETGFFVSQGGSWQSEYGRFFLRWYSGLLVRHADRVLGAAAEALNRPGRPRVLKRAVEVRGRRCLEVAGCVLAAACCCLLAVGAFGRFCLAPVLLGALLAAGARNHRHRFNTTTSATNQPTPPTARRRPRRVRV